MLLLLSLMGALIVANPAFTGVMVDISSKCASEAEAIDSRPAADFALPVYAVEIQKNDFVETGSQRIMTLLISKIH